MTSLNRRELLGVFAGVSATQLVPTRVSAASPTHYGFKLGEFDLTIFSDGHLAIPTRALARNASEADIKALIQQSADMVTPACNVTLVRTPSDLILIDVGAGPHFMPTAGKLADNMQAAGLDRKTVTKVVLTHAHPDHLWGLLDEFDDELMFPNASYSVPAAELNFWLADDVASRLPEDRQNFAPGARRNLNRIKERLTILKPGQDVATGIRAIDTSGHTPGHISIEIASGNQGLIVLADALTHPLISFAYPEWKPVADHYDPERAVVTRKGLLDRLATDQTRVVGFHFPFPGLGRVSRNGTSHRFIANP